MVNRVGGTFMMRIMEETGMPPAEVARAYTIVRKVFLLRDLWTRIEALDTKVPAAVQIAMLHDINRLLESATLWFLHNGARPLDINTQVDAFRGGVATLMAHIDQALPEAHMKGLTARARPLIESGVPKEVAIEVAAQVNLLSALDIVSLASARKMDVVAASRLYFSVGGRFRLGDLRRAAGGLASETHWQKLAIRAVVDELFAHQKALTAQVLDAAAKEKDPDKAIETWAKRHPEAFARTEQMLAELWAANVDDLAMIQVASRQLRALAAPAGA
jgi:glutamate dehydrogenase